MSFTPDKCSAINFSRKIRTISPSLKLGAYDITWVPSLRILGVWFDCRLSWNTHLSHVQGSVLRSLNAIRAVSHPRWGLRSPDALSLVKVVIRPLLEYAAPVLHSAPAYIYDALEVLLNSALRAALHLPRNVPIDVLRAESGVLSVRARIALLTSRFVSRHRSLGPDSIIAHLLTETEALSFYKWRNHAFPVGESISRLRNDGLLLDCAPIPAVPAVSLLNSGNYSVICSGLPFQNRFLHPALLRILSAEFLHAHHHSHFIAATDASQSNGSTAVGIYFCSTNISISIRLPSNFSVFSAEAFAILSAIRRLPPIQSGVLILSDCLSVLQALSSINCHSHSQVLALHTALLRLSSKVADIRLIWCPGHVGIAANEAADRAARLGHRLLQVENCLPPLQDVLFCYRRTLLDRAAHTWTRSGWFLHFPYIDFGAAGLVNFVSVNHRWCSSPSFGPTRLHSTVSSSSSGGGILQPVPSVPARRVYITSCSNALPTAHTDAFAFLPHCALRVRLHQLP